MTDDGMYGIARYGMVRKLNNDGTLSITLTNELESLGLHDGSLVHITQEGDKIIIRPKVEDHD